jgi:carbon storage regulator
MLVLTRKAQERIEIADRIRLTVLEIRGGRVKLGITAPPDVDVRRAQGPLTVASLAPARD